MPKRILNKCIYKYYKRFSLSEIIISLIYIFRPKIFFSRSEMKKKEFYGSFDFKYFYFLLIFFIHVLTRITFVWGIFAIMLENFSLSGKQLIYTFRSHGMRKVRSSNYSGDRPKS